MWERVQACRCLHEGQAICGVYFQYTKHSMTLCYLYFYRSVQILGNVRIPFAFILFSSVLLSVEVRFQDKAFVPSMIRSDVLKRSFCRPRGKVLIISDCLIHTVHMFSILWLFGFLTSYVNHNFLELYLKGEKSCRKLQLRSNLSSIVNKFFLSF